MLRQGSQRTEQAQECDRRLDRTRRLAVAGGGRRAELADRGGGEAQRRLGAGADVLGLRRTVLADRYAGVARVAGGRLAGQQLQQPHGLEEVETGRLVQQPAAQSSTFSPMRGGHRHKSSFRPSVVATSRVNELIAAYRARNRSS